MVINYHMPPEVERGTSYIIVRFGQNKYNIVKKGTGTVV